MKWAEQFGLLGMLILAGCPTGKLVCKVDSDCLTGACVDGVCGTMSQDSASSSSSTGGGTGPCPSAPGPTMVKLPEGYCIDSTEVTAGQYAAWLDGGPLTTGQRDFCSWNTSYQPGSGSGCSPPTEDFPVVCVDWCDAYAYCTGVGKRLCGAIGEGTYNHNDDYASAARSEWFNVCSSHGTNRYPYSAYFDSAKCNVAGNGGVARPVMANPNCVSPDAGDGGVWDLSGNASEWEASCDAWTSGAGENDHCRARGGDFLSNAGAVQCDSNLAYSRSYADDTIGFRCCATPQ